MTAGFGAHELPLPAAARALGLPLEAVEALIAAGYLRALPNASGERTVEINEIKAFTARNTADGRDVVDLRFEAGSESLESSTEALLAALRERSEDMASRAFDIFTAAFPEVDSWPPERKRGFIDNARDRFDAILAVTTQSVSLDADLVDDFAEVGVGAANTQTPLPEVLMTLRMSRDLVVQTAVDVAQRRGDNWTMPLVLVLMRLLPALDRLSDAITRGYWDTMMANRRV